MTFDFLALPAKCSRKLFDLSSFIIIALQAGVDHSVMRSSFKSTDELNFFIGLMKCCIAKKCAVCSLGK